MHRVMLAAVLALLPATAGAQHDHVRSLPLPQIGLPLPRLGLPPVRSIASPPPRPSSPPRPTAGLPRDRGRPHRGIGHGRSRSTVFVVPALYAPVYASTAAPLASTGVVIAVSPPPPDTAPGFVRIDIEPASAQLFIDGAYVGTPADGNAIAVTAGTHRLEIRARDYESVSLDMQVATGQTITYREPLRRADATPASPAAGTAASRTVYFVKGCYLGNVRPTPGSLPARCDLGEMVTYTPPDPAGPSPR